MPEFRCHDIDRLSVADVLKRMETVRTGLSVEETRRRWTDYGPNVLAELDRDSPLMLRGVVPEVASLGLTTDTPLGHTSAAPLLFPSGLSDQREQAP